MRRDRTLRRDELALWARATADAEPLPGRRPPPLPPGPPPPGGPHGEQPEPAPAAAAATPPRPTPRPAAPAAMAAPLTLDPARPVGLDRRTWLRLKRGQQPIDARLDLHGLTQDEAHLRLAGFLAEAQRRGHRCILVITGRGLRHGGVLRRMVPRWLAEAPNRGRVLTYSPARLHHGGEGALYLLLRRP